MTARAGPAGGAAARRRHRGAHREADAPHAGLRRSRPGIDRDALPPGPRWPALLQSIGLLRFRHQFVPWAHRSYGDVFTVRLLPGRPLVLFTRPEHAREIFAADPATFHAGKANAILGPMMGEHSLLLQDGTAHQRARKLLMPAFNGHALREYGALVTEVARAEVATWRHGEELRSLDRMNRLTLEVILRVVFGVTDERRLALLRPRVNRVVDISPAVLFGWSVPRLRRFGPWRAARQNAYELDQLIHAEIRERRAAPDLADPHRRALPAHPGRHRRRRGRPPHRRGAARPAGHPAPRRPRDHRDRAGVGALRARSRRGRCWRGRSRPPTTATTPGSRRCSRSRCGCTR